MNGNLSQIGIQYHPSEHWCISFISSTKSIYCIQYVRQSIYCMYIDRTRLVLHNVFPTIFFVFLPSFWFPRPTYCNPRSTPNVANATAMTQARQTSSFAQSSDLALIQGEFVSLFIKSPQGPRKLFCLHRKPHFWAVCKAEDLVMVWP